jgi:hypothetical protein
MKILTILIAFLLNACATNFNNYSVKKVGDEYITSHNYTFTNNTKIVIKFKKITPELINEFESKYNLQLNQILIIGDYIYSHNSDNIIELMKLIENDGNVKSMIPLWEKSVNLY